MAAFTIGFLKDESGATAMEYGLAVALVSLLVGAAIKVTGEALWGRLLNISTHI